VSFVTNSKSNWLLFTRNLEGNPCDGHTLSGALGQPRSLIGIIYEFVNCDQRYQQCKLTRKAKAHIVRKMPTQVKINAHYWVNCRIAAEPTIGLLKSDDHIDRNCRKGDSGDTTNVALATASYNLTKLFAWFYSARNIGRVLRQLLKEMRTNGKFTPIVCMNNSGAIKYCTSCYEK